MNPLYLLLGLELLDLIALALRQVPEAQAAVAAWREFAERLQAEARDATPEEVASFLEQSRAHVASARAALDAAEASLAG